MLKIAIVGLIMYIFKFQSNKVDVFFYNCIIICIIHGYGKGCTVGYKLLLSRMGAAKYKLVICCVTRYHMVTSFRLKIIKMSY